MHKIKNSGMYSGKAWSCRCFRIGIQWTFFFLPFIIIIAIAFLTVSSQSIKAAMANPVKSLRTE
jgi:hypothetical protein